MQLFDNRKRNAKDGNGPSGILMTFAEFEQELAKTLNTVVRACGEFFLQIVRMSTIIFNS